MIEKMGSGHHLSFYLLRDQSATVNLGRLISLKFVGDGKLDELCDGYHINQAISLPERGIPKLLKKQWEAIKRALSTETPNARNEVQKLLPRVRVEPSRVFMVSPNKREVRPEVEYSLLTFGEPAPEEGADVSSCMDVRLRIGRGSYKRNGHGFDYIAQWIAKRAIHEVTIFQVVTHYISGDILAFDQNRPMWEMVQISWNVVPKPNTTIPEVSVENTGDTEIFGEEQICFLGETPRAGCKIMPGKTLHPHLTSQSRAGRPYTR